MARKNQDSEQLTFDMSVVIDADQPLLNQRERYNALSKWLEPGTLKIESISGRDVIVYYGSGKPCVLLTKAITYLGNPHPIYKKRIQLPDWFQDLCYDIVKNKKSYDIKFLGIYHYKGNLVFVDFEKDSYLQHGLHNSSAHVYINDLYQGMTYGVFHKEDFKGNQITVIRNAELSNYLNDETSSNNESIFELFRKFNNGFTFGEWLYALDIIKEMHAGQWRNWKQAEWAGWFLEFKFDKFIKDHKLSHIASYTGTSNKRAGEFDFDIYFAESDFYGDLKASDIKHTETIGNDQNNLVECIYRYKRFWYVIYEHETIRDVEKDHTATIARNQYIRSVDPSYKKDDMSYSSRMKHSVKFMKMSIVELNAVNFREALKTFNQGHQPDGGKRAPKFNINKQVLKNDNFVVFRYNYGN